MKALVTGATGFIGGALTKRLLSDGYAVRAFLRNPRSAVWLKEASAELFKGDITDSDSCIEAAKGIDIIFHCAGVLGGWGKPDELFWKVNYEGTKNMIEAAQKTNVSRFVHVSTCGLFGSLEKGVLADETFPHKPHNIYEKTKSDAEKLVLEYAAKGLPALVVRPEFVYGPGDLHLLKFFRAVKAGRFVFFGNGESTMHPTYIDDVVDGILLAANNPEALGRAFNIPGPRPVKVREFVKCMSDAMGVPLPSINISVPLAKSAALFLDYTWGLVAKPPLSYAQVKYLSENTAFNRKLAENLLGHIPKVDVAVGVRRTVEWYKSRNLL